MALINASICLTDIPKEKIKLSEKNGKKYLNIVIADKRETDQYGYDTTVYISQTKEDRDAETQKIYIGNGKKVVFNNGGSTAAAPQQNTAASAQQPIS